MNLSEERTCQITGGVWLIGIGVLFATGWWWPGIMFVIGIATIVQGLMERRGWDSFQPGIWSLLIGVWAYYRFNVPMALVALGLGMIVVAIARPSVFSKPKPFTDNTLE